MTYQNPTGGSDDAVAVPYRPPTAGLPLETFTLSSLIHRRGRAELEGLQRPEFDLLVWCRDGSGTHHVDFEPIELVPGRVVHVRPGQVHRWTLDPLYGAQLFVMRPLAERGDWSRGAHVIDADTDLVRDLDQIVAMTDPASRSAPLSVRSLEAIRDLLTALLRLGRPYDANESYLELIYREFERLVAETFPPPRTVNECAQLLGCSARTLTRACRSATSIQPKQLIDEAVALEAQRQLSEGNTATRVAGALDFAELSHFTRFFKRVTGETPSSFAAGFTLADA